MFESLQPTTSDINKVSMVIEESDTEILLQWESKGVPVDRSVVYQMAWREDEHSDWMIVKQVSIN